MRKEVPRVSTALLIINIAVFLLAEVISGSTENTGVLISWGGAYVPYIRDGQYWRLLTSMFMHSGIRHLLNNMMLLYVLGQHLEYLMGSPRFALLYLLGGFLADTTAYFWYLYSDRMVVSVGASGAIFAEMGALIWIVARNRGRVDGLTMKQMLLMMAFSLYFGFMSAGVSNIAHIGGLVFGWILAVFLYRKNTPYDHARYDSWRV